MDSDLIGTRSQLRHYPYWYEGTLSTWRLAKYPRIMVQSIGLLASFRRGSPSNSVKNDQIVAVHEFGF